MRSRSSSLPSGLDELFRDDHCRPLMPESAPGMLGCPKASPSAGNSATGGREDKPGFRNILTN